MRSVGRVEGLRRPSLPQSSRTIREGEVTAVQGGVPKTVAVAIPKNFKTLSHAKKVPFHARREPLAKCGKKRRFGVSEHIRIHRIVTGC
jgi:hypothetical protein